MKKILIACAIAAAAAVGLRASSLSLDVTACTKDGVKAELVIQLDDEEQVPDAAILILGNDYIEYANSVTYDELISDAHPLLQKYADDDVLEFVVGFDSAPVNVGSCK